ncbi:MAG: molybdenum cofactor biosynthesis protein MoaE [Cyclobacteriaceae bacterium]
MEQKIRKPKNIFVQGPITPEKIADYLAHQGKKYEVGGISTFIQQMQGDTKSGGTIKAIHYTAIEERALQKAFEIREDIFTNYPIRCMHIYHSLGEIKTGEICFFVMVSASNNKAAIDACEETVERILKEVPIWGK